MALLKSYSCVKCGGILNFDEDQEIFGCPFCGTNFSFTDFHRDDLIKQARASLASGNYRTAADKYTTIINSNSRDFEALQGLTLSCALIPSIDKFDQIDDLDKADFKRGRKAALYAKDMLKEEADYFGLLADMFSAAEEYFQNRERFDRHTESVRKGYREMSLVSNGVDEGVGKALGIVGIAAVVLWYVSFITAAFVDTLWPVVIGLGLLAVAVILIFVIAKIVTHSTLKRKAEYLSSLQKTDPAMIEEMNKYKNAYNEAYRKFRKLSPDAGNYTVFSAKTGETGKRDPFIDISKTINCAKCGGQLKLDKEKRLYECRYCGIAYGASLFFNDPLKKAEKAQKECDFSEADRRFSHVLMVEPSNPRALLGRVLCAGNWRTIHDIVLRNTEVPDAVASDLKERASEAVLHSPIESKSFFEDIQKLTDMYCEHENLAPEIRKYDEKLEYYNRNRTLITAKPGAEKVLNEEINKIASKRRDALAKSNRIRFDFDRIRTKLLNERKHLFSVK